MKYKEFLSLALDSAMQRGVNYADVRIVDLSTEDLSVKNGQPESIQSATELGFGVRVLYKGAWGYCASSEMTKDSAKRIGLKAVEIAKASSKVMKIPVVLSPLEKVIGSYRTPVQIDPFTVNLEEKISYLLSVDELLRKVDGITLSNVFMSFRKEKKYFISSEGSEIEQEIIHSGAGMSATAMKSRKERGVRSFPSSEGQHETKGYELIKSLKLKDNAERIASEAVALISAKPCPEGEFDVIIESSHLSLVIHESIGHPLELDRVFGSEENFSGTSFATVDNLNKLKYASDIVHITADATAEGGLGTFGYDDEGVPAQKADLIKDGILVGYLTSREYASRIKRTSIGAMRADGFGNVPLIRMTNTNLKPGNITLDELIADTKEGLYLATTSSWSIDDRRENFRFGTEIGWEIKNGKLGDVVKNPSYSGNTVKFWNSCDAICNDYRIWGTPSCGKGQPGQNGRVGQGASSARFRKVKVG